MRHKYFKRSQLRFKKLENLIHWLLSSTLSTSSTLGSSAFNTGLGTRDASVSNLDSAATLIPILWLVPNKYPLQPAES